MKASAYNFALPTADNSWLLFNIRTGKSANIAGKNAASVIKNLTGYEDDTDIEIDAVSLDLLFKNEFVLEDNFDELSAIRDAYRQARDSGPVVLTITTTLDCNLGCFYCYESRSGGSLTLTDIPAITEMARKTIIKSGKPSVHVDWYGGEPTLNLAFLEAASRALQMLCDSLRIGYSASIVSNGTSWPKDLRSFITEHQIRQVQISFDGLRVTHNKRRRFTHKADNARSSFDEAVAVVSELVDLCRVDIRFNVDETNKNEFVPFVEFAKSQSWFDGAFRATFQPARVGAYSDKSRFVERIELPEIEFRTLKKRAAEVLPVGTMEEPEMPNGYAAPKKSVCAALSKNAAVIGADRQLYRCGLQVSEPLRCVGKLEESPFKIIGLDERQHDEIWWDEFDPTLLPTCSKCSFLPICLGGCPKKQLEKDSAALHAQSVYWRENLARLICKTVGIPEINASFAETDQFRSAMPTITPDATACYTIQPHPAQL